MEFSNKTVLITGAAQGIGRAIAEKFAQYGATLVVGDVNDKKLIDTAKEIHALYHCDIKEFHLNITDIANIKEVITYITDKYEKIDILINNAGVCNPYKPFEEIDDEEWSEVLGINLMGAVNCIKAVIPIMKKRNCGKIVNMASSAGETGGISVSTTYAVSKAGVMCLTKSLAKALGQYNINVNAIAPGIIQTSMTSDLEYNMESIPLGKFGMPQDVADLAVFLASEESKYITGSTIDINGGLYMK